MQGQIVLFKSEALTLHDFLLVAEPGRVLLLSCEELELISSSSSSSSSKFILLDIPSNKKVSEIFIFFKNILVNWHQRVCRLQQQCCLLIHSQIESVTEEV